MALPSRTANCGADAWERLIRHHQVQRDRLGHVGGAPRNPLDERVGHYLPTYESAHRTVVPGKRFPRCRLSPPGRRRPSPT
jgi:hypothetical protein